MLLALLYSVMKPCLFNSRRFKSFEGTVTIPILSIGADHFLNKSVPSLLFPYTDTGNILSRLFIIVTSIESALFVVFLILKSMVLRL